MMIGLWGRTIRGRAYPSSTLLIVIERSLIADLKAPLNVSTLRVLVHSARGYES